MSEFKRKSTDGEIEISQPDFTGMVTLRADLANSETIINIERIIGLKLPEKRKLIGDLSHGMAWMSPDELLVFCADPAAMAAQLNAGLSGAFLVADVSHARAVFLLQGDGVREVLAKGAPVDLSPEVFLPDDFRRTRMGQVAVAFWMSGQSPDSFGLICFASVQEFMFDWLVTASKKGSLPHYL